MAGVLDRFQARWRAGYSDQVRFGRKITYQEIGAAVKELLKKYYNVAIKKRGRGFRRRQHDLYGLRKKVLERKTVEMSHGKMNLN